MTQQILGMLQYSLINGKTKIRLYNTVIDAFKPEKKNSDLYDLTKVIKYTFSQNNKMLRITYHTNSNNEIVFSFKVSLNKNPTKFCLIDKLEFN